MELGVVEQFTTKGWRHQGRKIFRNCSRLLWSHRRGRWERREICWSISGNCSGIPQTPKAHREHREKNKTQSVCDLCALCGWNWAGL